MIARTGPSNGQAAALAMALLAITFTFLQPLAHAALMRDGVPSALWSVFCKSAVADPDSAPASLPVTAEKHECCLGLAHAFVIEAPEGFVPWMPAATALAPSLPSPQSAAGGIRDGPARPRGPPSFA